ncbi:CHAT domain-containing protein, partial [Thiohalorhabdus sp. Cl-TMA]
HFATHGILSGDLPGLTEAALVLADSEESDGLLTASEIANLGLDTRLAVLSACNTGNGEQIAGEGLVGVSRAFLTAGTEGVVASLWPVDSTATVALMEAFYEQLGQGLAPAAALRQAKLALREQHRAGAGPTRALKAQDTEAPADRDGAYFWSPFILVTLEH